MLDLYAIKKRGTYHICLLLSLCLLITGCQFSQEATEVLQQPPEQDSEQLINQPTYLPSTPVDEMAEPEAEKEADPVIKTVQFMAVGDVIIHRSVYYDARLPGGGFDFTPMFSEIKPYLSQADLAFVNQESMPGGTELGLSDYPRFNSPFEIIDALQDTGFHVIGLANNHTIDRGAQAVYNAIEYIEGKDLMYVGAYKSFEDQETLRIIEVNDITFAFIAYSYGTNGIPVPKGQEYLVNLISSERYIGEISLAKEQADVIVASLHFGQEYVNLPTEEQELLAWELAQAGVDIIVGHHPHVLQPFDWIEREAGGRTLVMYSLGNFLSAQDRLPRLLGGIGGVKVIKTVLGDQVTVELDSPSFFPTYNYYRNWRNFKIKPLINLDDTYLPDAKRHTEAVIGHIKLYMPELQIHDLESLTKELE